jgi:hypothetical protein
VTARLTHIGRDLQTRILKLFDNALEPDATPLEICQAVLADVERHVQPLGRGRRVFPYSTLVVRVRQSEPDRAPVEPAFEEFETRVLERLAEIRCEAPPSIDFSLVCLESVPGDWPEERMFAVEYVKPVAARAPHDAVAGDPQPALNVVVVRGATTESQYRFTDPVVSIGRTSDPTDALGRPRRNRVAFLDTVDGITETVGRAHALVRFDASSGEYRLFDEGSSNGTSILRGGATIPVHPRDPRGVRVRSGDEVLLGRAVVRVELD